METTFRTELCEWTERPYNVRAMCGGQVRIALHAIVNTDRVYWTKKGCNSFVCVRDVEGDFKTVQGERCFLVSVNGVGELRWSVTPTHPTAEEKDAVQYFRLDAVRLQG